MTNLRRPWRRDRSGDDSGPGRSLRRRRLLMALAAVALIGFGADFGAAQLIKAKVAEAAQLLHGSTSVDLSGAPALVDLVTGQVPEVHIDATHASLCKVSGLSVSADLTNVSSNSQNQLSVGATRATVSINRTALSHALGQKLPAAAIRPDPAGNMIVIDAGPGGLLQLRIRPLLSGNTLSVKLLSASVLGRPASPTVVDRLRQHVSFSRALTNLPLDLTPSHVSVTHAGIAIHMSGGSWQGNIAGSSGAGTCV